MNLPDAEQQTVTPPKVNLVNDNITNGENKPPPPPPQPSLTIIKDIIKKHRPPKLPPTPTPLPKIKTKVAKAKADV